MEIMMVLACVGLFIFAVLLFVAPLGIWMTLHRIEAEQKKVTREAVKQTKLLTDAVELLSALVSEEDEEV